MKNKKTLAERFIQVSNSTSIQKQIHLLKMQNSNPQPPPTSSLFEDVLDM